MCFLLNRIVTKMLKIDIVLGLAYFSPIAYLDYLRNI